MEDFATIRQISEGLLADPLLSQGSLPELAQPSTIDSWAQESLSLAKKQVCSPEGPFDLQSRNISDFPVGYGAISKKIAHRRVVLAGHRLAEELRKIYAPSNP